MLRFVLDEESIQAAARELNGVEPLLDRRGLATAEQDIGLETPRNTLESRPLLQSITDRVRLWYDYSSLPQPPRDDQEREVFESGLEMLNAIQMMGRTVILLDEPEQYLSRAWCTLEAVCGNLGAAIPDFLNATTREAATDGAEDYFLRVMDDRPHFVRRGLLDTLLFKKQSRQECFNRLEIALNDPADLDYVFDQLVNTSQASGIHVDSSSVITGTLPLPKISEDRVVLLPAGGDRIRQAEDVQTLDWTNALSLQRIDESDIEVFESHQEFEHASAKARCHVIVVCDSEGDAVLAANWARARRGQVEQATGTTVSAISWLSDDIAPVGHMPSGRLEPTLSDSDTWCIAAGAARLEHDPLCRRLRAAALGAGLTVFFLQLDSVSENLHRFSNSDDAADTAPETIPTSELELRPIQGGVFADGLGNGDPGLFRRPIAAPTPTPFEDAGPAPEDLQVVTINACFSDDVERLNSICRDYPRAIHEGFKDWTTIPESLRDDPAATNAYAEALTVIAATMRNLGHPDPLESLASEDDSPIARWNHSFARASQSAEEARYGESNELLQTLIDDLESCKGGSAIDDLLPKVLGMYGTNLFQLGLLDEARDYTRRARDRCRSIGDTEGVVCYDQNLAFLERAEGPSNAHSSKVADAQGLSDLGRYHRSNAILQSIASDAPESLRCKIHGLMGANFYWLGDLEAAEHHHATAIELATSVDDVDAERIYRNNLEVVRTDGGRPGDSRPSDVLERIPSRRSPGGGDPSVERSVAT